MDWRLERIKILHTAIWVGFNIILFYMLFAVITNRIDKWVWLGVGAVVLEGVVLLIFKLTCPLTLLARRYSDSTKDNFDIYLPNWLAKYTKVIYTSLFGIIVCLLAYRLLTN
ncbi:hypothetical protein [Chryseolinea lacunae]|uniref:DUF2784 domain-containing protein n=1 Tax=Chryseolinea lacunae TaxID=2801331 RepID=A0ABS1KW59_9BACT|nr:hypothetical protein [Chryseolinea lacunae]MBL0743701.1 hypothetical protein [Chryseolinea lacunae]